jgi:8-amino-7-oxononanoate synthase
MSVSAETFLKQRLQKRINEDALRKLELIDGLIDFGSNDYLGLSKLRHVTSDLSHGSTGSRLISGNSTEAEQLEAYLSAFHKFESCLLFNSGYAANVGLFSALSQKDVTFCYDELIHASVRDGLRMGFGKSYSFRHNDVNDLQEKLSRDSSAVKFIAVESLYSMDGDIAPLKEICDVAMKHDSAVIVDEAHSTGVFGDRGEGLVVELGLSEKIFARLHTFGKAMGCHGAVIGGSNVLREFMVNYCRSFIYSTFLPPADIHAIRESYKHLEGNPSLITELRSRIELFRSLTGSTNEGPIQIIPVNDRSKALEASRFLKSKGFFVKAVLSPTVPAGTERLRICLHTYNTDEEIAELYVHIQSAIN